MPDIRWDSGTAYDFFASLHVMHAPADYGVRASWAAGIRSRLAAPSRDFLAALMADLMVPAGWLLRMAGPKTARAALDALDAIPDPDVLPAIFLDPGKPEPIEAVYRRVMAARAWSEADLDAVKACMPEQHARGKQDGDGKIRTWLGWWAAPAAFAASLRSSLRDYYEVFFREEERRIAPDVEKGLQRARDLSARLEPAALFEELSQGIQVGSHMKHEVITFVPCWWCSPRILYTDLVPGRHEIVLFGCRPAEASLVPGDTVPGRLLLALEALSDPTRLTILRTLAREPLTQAGIARALRLRPPTISHHLKSLRIAGLIAYIDSDTGEMRYGLRAPQLEQTCALLREFLSPQ